MPQDSVLIPLLFLFYTNDLTANLKCDVKMISMTHFSSRFLMMEQGQLMSFMQILTKFSYGHGSGRCNSMQTKLRKLSSLVKK